MSIEYPWYSLIQLSGEILQGDFIENCPVIIPPKKLDQKRYTVDVKTYDLLVISQSCDIEQSKLDYILMCQYYPLSKLENISPFNNPVGREILRRGNFNGLHLLNRCEISGNETDFLVVDFRKVYSIHKNFLIDFAKSQKKRLRLLSPYREHLSQAFARYFMRIGLPKDIPPFINEIYRM